jgi:hypothetical protein
MARRDSACRSRGADLILLDVMLPKLDGYRHDQDPVEAPPVLPIIMLTAEREVEQKVRGLRAGADDYLIKPFHPAELLAGSKACSPACTAGSLLARPPLGRILAFYGAKGGWGRRPSRSTAIALHRELGRKVALVDGNLQFGDHRVFLDLGLDQEHRRPGDRAVDRCRPRPPGHGRHGPHRPAASAAFAGDRRAGPSRAPAGHREQLSSSTTTR